MLFRFNAAQQSEKGIITRGQRRPRMASSVTSIRECENWRGEVLRDISRKVDKIQDSSWSLLWGKAHLTDVLIRFQWV